MSEGSFPGLYRIPNRPAVFAKKKLATGVDCTALLPLPTKTMEKVKVFIKETVRDSLVFDAFRMF